MNRYTVSSLIGEGSFGRVYRAARKVDDQIVALKIISKQGRSNRELKNLRRECDIQAKLKHPNVIEMFESFETKHNLVVVTDFAQIDLHRYLAKNGAISEEKAQKLICHLVSALYYLHSNRILHRDLKPQNVLLNDDLQAKLCDFGLARNMTMGTHVLTSIKGTPLYMAPELLAERPYDHQADLWSLGCISYETMAGQPPFCTTSILHLVKLIKHEEVKWPSFLSSDCRSFLQGLLEKDPSLRITWAQILCHPFVEGKLFISGIMAENSPFINPKKNSRAQKQSSSRGSHDRSNDENLSKNLASLSLQGGSQCTDNLTSSRDSVNAILQSDIENLETDVEDVGNIVTVPFSDRPYKIESSPAKSIDPLKSNQRTSATPNAKFCFVSGNSNMIVNHLNDNFKSEQPPTDTLKSKANLSLNIKKATLPSAPEKNISRNKDLEKRKLSQNLDNFSLRLGNSVDVENGRKCGEKKDKLLKTCTQSTEEKQNENTPPCLLPGWDSCDESQSPVIENEEWLAFLHRSVQEVLDGELDSLKQQNLVSIIVAPLRNTNATPKVVEGVAQLLSLPLVLGGPSSVIDLIKTVYAEVKLVPNLMFASKLLISTKSINDSNSSLPPSSNNRNSIRSVSELTKDEIITISRLYELICHLVHLKEQFLSQFCDAVVILSADELLINFLSHDFKNKNTIRITNCVIALLCCILRELPENADLVEKIIFSPKLDLINLMKHEDQLLRMRICMLFRLLGRFSLRGLQSIWSSEVRKIIESFVDDKSEEVRMEAQCMLDELKHFSFYA
ncbi:serine/threonine-protein kinase fused [Episyrphus balteatus]|uniref:serine/threonine-protein kinase fused n=1 Tax=Episyrphus balteatus TaxID=286459 RepID=UPI0024858B0C|nr:serine/threonine-protein kinase fused [Episyrphus balteatus]